LAALVPLFALPFFALACLPLLRGGQDGREGGAAQRLGLGEAYGRPK